MKSFVFLDLGQVWVWMWLFLFCSVLCLAPLNQLKNKYWSTTYTTGDNGLSAPDLSKHFTILGKLEACNLSVFLHMT